MSITTRIANLCLSGLFSCLAATGAHADTTVQLNETGLGLGMSTGGLILPVQSSAANFWSGFQTIKVTDGAATNSFQAFCIDPFQWSSSTPGTYTLTSFAPTFDAAHIANITKLFNYAYATATSNLNAAALQLALWEVANDDGNLATGGVKTTSGTNALLISATNALLNNYASASAASLYSFSFYKSSSNQDFVTVSAIPEVSTYAMMLAGLGLIGTIARRRKTKENR
jgi:hypothetical protein